jgi:gas vesicle protein
MSQLSRRTLEERVQKAILQHAIFRWESAVVIGLTIVLTGLAALTRPFNFAWLFSLVGGMIGEAALVYSSLRDPETGRQVVANMLRDEFHPERLRDKQLQQQIGEAFDYRSRIEAAIRERRDTVLKDNLSETARQIDEWLENIYSLAQRLDRHQAEKKILDRDRARADERLRQLQKQLKSETDPAVRRQMETNIESLRRQVETIDTLNSTMDRARLQLENTLSALGTIYSQTMLIGARDIDSGRARRLRQEIVEEVEDLGDILAAMEEVYATQT